MRLALAAACVGMASFVGAKASAQTTPQPLPPITVETQKNKAKAKPKIVQAPKASPTQASTPAPPPQETATGPVQGIVAKQSATGSKTDTPIVELPRTVNVVTKDQISEQQPVSVREALGYTPGVQNQTGSTSNLDDITVRGFLAPIYLDGLLLVTGPASNARLRLEPYGLERLEVLKGPASALYGQVPPGGLINGVSKRPQLEPHNEVFLQYGTNDYRATGFDFTGPAYKAGELSYRIVGLVRDTDLDIDHADRQRYYLAPSVTWRPSTATTLTILGSIQRDSGYGPRQYVPLALTRESWPVGRISRTTNLGEPSLDTYTEDQWQVGYSLTHRVWPGLQFRQNVRYMEVEQETLNVRASGLVSGSNQSVNRTLNGTKADLSGVTLDNQVQADFATYALRHRVLAGLDYQHVNSYTNFSVVLPFAFSPINAYNPVYGNYPVSNPFTVGNPISLNDSVLQQTGIYLQDQIKLGRWIATIGGRYDWATTDLEDLRPAASRRSQSIDDEKFTGSVGLSYLFDNGLAPYVSYSTSFLPFSGTAASSLINPSTGKPYQPTTGEGLEAGIKYQPVGTNTLITASVFEITQQNVTTTIPAAIPITAQTGEVRMRGVEVEAKAELTRNLQVLGGYGYVEPIITKTGAAANIGNDLQGIARHTASAWAMYKWHEGHLAGFGIGAGLRYVGSHYAEEANTNKVPGFALLDAAVSYDLKYLDPAFKGTKLQVNAYNLTDEYYIANCATASFCQLGQARSAIATLKYEW